MFDARAAKLLAPGAHLTFDGSPGFRLEATASTRAWVYRYKSPLDGRMRQCKIGLWPAMAYQAAWVEWDRLRTERERGIDPALEKRNARLGAKLAIQEAKAAAAGPGPLTVARLCQLYVDNLLKRNRQEKGWKEVKRMFDTMLGDLAEVLAVDVTRRTAYQLIEGHVDTPHQAKALRSELGGAWDYGLDSGELPESTPNWWRGIMRGKIRLKPQTAGGKAKVPKRTLSPIELGALLRWLPNFPPNTRDVLILYAWTLCRGAEIVAMHTDELQEERQGDDVVLWWTIPKAKTKNARIEGATDLRVPLIGRAAAVVRSRTAHGYRGFVFPSHTRLGHIQQRAVSVAVWGHMPYSETRPEYERPRLPVTMWAPHDLRRTSRTLLASMGCVNEIGEALLGHMQEGIVGVYNLHTYDAERLQWLGLLDKRLEQLAAAKEEKPA
jgi:integrase